MMDISQYMQQVGQQAKRASRHMARASSAQKDQALRLISAAILRETDAIRSANLADMEAARVAGLAPALLDRLSLSESAIKTMAEGLLQIASLPDPIGDRKSVV